ncbi:MAG: hypothetical protein KatS3mg111_1046 [Pirellulaceae bacterium]|nr:MAG: hypothetical protein KatS3mg111_1046 [Pirellulaceae bacterium]
MAKGRPAKTVARLLHVVARGLAYLWASPNSALGLVIGFVGLLTGGKVQRRGPTLEFYGGAVSWLLSRTPLGQSILAMTLGHVILGSSAAALDIAREHEWVHVRQYERWGPAMIPAYLLASVIVFLRGKRAYRDNPFERAAYDATSLRYGNFTEDDGPTR